MSSFITTLVGKFEVDLKDDSKNRNFYDSLRELVTILFAVIFGYSLSELGHVKDSYDGAVLILAYLAVALSWWGYHKATILGPKETNRLSYLIDCLLLAIYWFLINIRSPLTRVLSLYLLMFVLYLAWELIRGCKQERTPWERVTIAKASRVNLMFVTWVSVLYVSAQCLNWSGPSVADGYYIGVLFTSVILYRVWIGFVYRPQESYAREEKIALPADKKSEDLEAVLLKRARTVASSARAHISNFKVGAAILADSRNIYVGCNIEFDNFSNTIHAEEAAISSFVVGGEKKPLAIAVYTPGAKVSFPCGMCLQSLFELGGRNLRVTACNNSSSQTKTVGELLPAGFQLR